MTESRQDVPQNQIREDATIRYSWVPPHGARYRDFSASRRETRARFLNPMPREQAKPEGREAEKPELQAELEPEEQAPQAHEAVEEARGGMAAGTGTPLEAKLEANLEANPGAASRWFVLRDFLATAGESAARPSREERVPAALIFSLAGGAGKTSLAATLGRALATQGERVLLAETSSWGPLPFYFGSLQLKPGVLRTFAPPEGGADAPVLALALETGERSGQPGEGDPLLATLLREGKASSRILVDIQTAARDVAWRLLPLTPVVLVPLLPDMNSVVSLDSIGSLFAGRSSSSGQVIEPFYLLNQFDASLPLHVDVQQVLRQRLGDRLLPFVVRHSPAVSEALAEGMTVMDYAPNSPAAADYIHLARWLRGISAPSIGLRRLRWVER